MAKGDLAGIERPFAHCTQSYQAIFANDGTITREDVPDILINAVRNAVISSIPSRKREDFIESIDAGIFQEEGVPEHKQSVGVIIETPNETVGLNQLKELKAELEQTVDLQLEHISVHTTGEIADIEEVYD